MSDNIPQDEGGRHALAVTEAPITPEAFPRSLRMSLYLVCIAAALTVIIGQGFEWAWLTEKGALSILAAVAYLSSSMALGYLPPRQH